MSDTNDLMNFSSTEVEGSTEVVLLLAFGASGTAERDLNGLMRWRRGKMSGHNLAREPVLGEQRDYRLGEMPLPVRPVEPLIGAKRSPDGPGRAGPITFSKLPNSGSSNDKSQNERNSDTNGGDE